MEELPHSIAAVKAGDPSPGVRHVALGVQHAYLGVTALLQYLPAPF